MLIHMDATPFEWFNGTNKFALHGAIDDASGEIVGPYITKNECLHGYLETTRQMIFNYGITTAKIQMNFCLNIFLNLIPCLQ